MKQINILTALLVCLFLGLTSCSNDDELLTGQGGKEEVELTAVTFNFGSTSATRMAGGVSGDDDAFVDNVWVLQYDVTGGAETICMAQYVEAYDSGGDNVANIFLESSDSKDYRVFCLANTNDVQLFSDPAFTGFATISQLKTMVKQLSAKTAEKAMWEYKQEDGTIRQSLLMKGVARDQSITPPSDSTDEFTVQILPGAVKNLDVQLFHLTARVSLNLYHQYKIAGVDDFFKLLSVQLKNVPSKLGYFGDAALASTDYIDYKSESIADGSYDEAKKDIPKEFTWYIPRNPATSTDGATYIEVTGYDKNKRVTTYSFYPHTESSSVYDYALESGHAYSYDATIKGSLITGNTLAETKHFNVSVENAMLNSVPANCYVVTGGRLTSIPLSRVKEYNNWLVANNTSNNGYAEVMEESAEWTAEILWSDVDELVEIKGGAGKGIEDQFILVKPKNDQVVGNALLLLKDSNDEVVWSWHLWVLPSGLSTRSYTPHNRTDGVTSANDTENSEVNPVGVTYDVLTLNLGATAEGRGTTSRGLFYQWGRKDPFPKAGSTSETGTSALATGYYNGDGGDYYFNCVSISTTERNSSALHSSRNPDMFYTSNWLGSGYGSLSKNDGSYSWENDLSLEKSIFDPCPPGYRVPDEKFFGTELSNKMNRGGSNSAWSTGWDWTTVYRYDDQGNIAGFNGPGAFPAAGNRNYSTGTINNAGSYGYYWSSLVSSTTNAYGLNFNSTTVYTRYSNYRSFGFSVRCVAPQH